MIKNLMLATIVVFGGIVAISLVFTLLDLLMAFVKYKKAVWHAQVALNQIYLFKQNNKVKEQRESKLDVMCSKVR
jgi:hypothetical protein